MENKTIFCPGCGHKQPASNLFCTNCGTPLPRLDDLEQQPKKPTNDPGTDQATNPGTEAGQNQTPQQPQPQNIPPVANANAPRYSIPGQIPLQERKKKGNGLVIAITAIIAALVIAGGAVAGVYFAGGFDSFFDGGGSVDDDDDDGGEKKKDKDKNKDKDTGADETDKAPGGFGDMDGEETDGRGDGTDNDRDDPDSVKNVHYVCDFEAFSKDEAKLTAKKDFGDYIGYQFRVPSDAAVQIGGDYVMDSLYDMDFLNPLDDYENDDSTVLAAAFGYSGDEDIESFDDDEKDFYGAVIELEIDIDESEDYAVVKIYVSKGIGFRDNGDRTTFDRDLLSGGDVEVGGVSIALKGQLYIDGALSDWIPEGYYMEMDVYVFGTNGVVLDETPTITVDNESVLQYDSYRGRLTAVGPGKATVTASVGDVYDTYTISVYSVKNIGNYMSAEPEQVDIPYGADPFYFTTTLTMDFTAGGDSMHVNVMTPYGVTVTKYGEWVGNSIDITFYIDPDEMDRNYDFVALICGFVFYEDDGLDYSSDLCSTLALYE